MHANRNKGALKKVEKGMMKANRIRNIFAVLAVVLTTFMITTVFSLGINYMQNMELSSVRTAGSNADVTLNAPTNEQEQQIRSLDYVKTIGTRYMIGSAVQTNSEGRESSIVIQYYMKQNGNSILRKQSAISTALTLHRKTKLCCLRTLLHSLELKRRR